MTTRPASLQTSRWKPSLKMCWLKSSAFNGERSAVRSPRHEPKPKKQPPSNGHGDGQSDAARAVEMDQVDWASDILPTTVTCRPSAGGLLVERMSADKEEEAHS
jgi:hypothetical protein